MPRKKDYKQKIFLEVFRSKVRANTLGQLVTLADISVQIASYNVSALAAGEAEISARNPANFFKDYIRNTKTANARWPRLLRRLRYTAVQETGKGNSFRFVPYAKGQLQPFTTVSSPLLSQVRKIQSLSLSSLSRKLGRQDETWLMQVAVRLNLIETHLAYTRYPFEHIDHLQIGVKLNKAEIDALYVGRTAGGHDIVITVEAKGSKDDIYDRQILSQIDAVKKMKTLKGVKAVLPMAIKIIGNSTVLIVTFKAVDLLAATPRELKQTSAGVYRLCPSVGGIS